jgi:hypothetical protein
MTAKQSVVLVNNQSILTTSTTLNRNSNTSYVQTKPGEEQSLQSVPRSTAVVVGPALPSTGREQPTPRSTAVVTGPALPPTGRDQSVPRSAAAVGPTAPPAGREQPTPRSTAVVVGPAAPPAGREHPLVAMEKQRLPIDVGNNMESVNSSDVSGRSSIVSTTSIPTVNNVEEQARLLEPYMSRRTTNSAYRTLSINAWSKSDVLDFLFDRKLYSMMPLCELMGGQAFTRMFRMCQEKPSRLHRQLNKELRTRFNGLCLPISVYNQFLNDMNILIGPGVPTSSRKIPTRENLAERVMAVPTIPPRVPTSAISTVEQLITYPSASMSSPRTNMVHDTRSFEGKTS